MSNEDINQMTFEELMQAINDFDEYARGSGKSGMLGELFDKHGMYPIEPDSENPYGPGGAGHDAGDET